MFIFPTNKSKFLKHMYDISLLIKEIAKSEVFLMRPFVIQQMLHFNGMKYNFNRRLQQFALLFTQLNTLDKISNATVFK